MNAAQMRDRDLVRLHWARDLRPAFDALFAIDDAMASVVQNASQPALAAIKLAWWRERLEELDAGKVPAEPRLQEAASELLPRGIKGAELAELERGWAALLDENPDVDAVVERGVTLFRLGGRLLGDLPPLDVQLTGALYAAGNLHRLGLTPAGLVVVTHIGAIPRQFRPLTALAALARRDVLRREPGLEPEATPGRSWALLKHRLTGR